MNYTNTKLRIYDEIALTKQFLTNFKIELFNYRIIEVIKFNLQKSNKQKKKGCKEKLIYSTLYSNLKQKVKVSR